MGSVFPKMTEQECYERCENDCKESWTRVGADWEETVCSNKGKTYVNTCLLWCEKTCIDGSIEEVYKGHCEDFNTLIDLLDED